MSVVASSLGAFTVAYLLFKNKKPLMLDIRDPQKPMSFEAEYDIRELTPWLPYSMGEVEEYLRIRQNSVLIGASSGMLRLDVGWAESNTPVEDTMDHSVIVEGTERQWTFLGIYDGHWGCETAYTLHWYCTYARVLISFFLILSRVIEHVLSRICQNFKDQNTESKTVNSGQYFTIRCSLPLCSS